MRPFFYGSKFTIDILQFKYLVFFIVVWSTYHEVIRCEYDEETMKVFAKPLSHEDQKGDHIVDHPYKGDQQEERWIDFHVYLD